MRISDGAGAGAAAAAKQDEPSPVRRRPGRPRASSAPEAPPPGQHKLRSGKLRRSLLGELPDAGLRPEQFERVREVVEGDQHGLVSAARELHIQKTALRHRLYQVGFEVQEAARYWLAPADPDDAAAKELAERIARENPCEPVETEAESERLHRELYDAAQATLPFERKGGLTYEQLAVAHRVAVALRYGAKGIARFYGVTQPVIAIRLGRVGLKVDSEREYRLAPAKQIPVEE